MSPIQELLAVAAALYLYECIALVPRGAILIQSRASARFRARQLTQCFGSSTKAITLGMPLPPLGTVYVSGFWPLSLSAEGVSNRPVSQPDLVLAGQIEDAFVRMDNVRGVSTRGSVLCVNGADLTDCGSEAAAARWRRFLQQVAQESRERRGPCIEAAIHESLDTDRTAAAVTSVKEAVHGLRIACNILFVYLFVYCPFIVWRSGLADAWWFLLAALVPLWFLPVFMFVRAHRKLFPDRVSERRKQALVLGLTPFGVVRACDAVTRYALVDHHPLAISAVLCGESAHRQFARRVYADLLHPVDHNGAKLDSQATSTEQWLREKLLAATERCLQSSAIDVTDLLMPPEPDDETCQSYCPRCRSQYVTVDSECPGCSGVKLRKFSDNMRQGES